MAMLCTPAMAQGGTVDAPRVGQQSGATRLVMDLAPGQTSRIEPMGAALRIVFPGSVAPVSTIKKFWRAEFRGYTITNKSEGAVLDLVTPQGVSKRSGFRAQVLAPSAGKTGSRLVIDISGAYADISPLPPTKPFQFVRAAGQRFTVVLDPGHGGNDPGAVGHVKEEPLNLEVAKRVGAHLQAAGVTVEFTRQDSSTYTKEKTLDLATRAAQSRNKSLYISIHANARPRRNAIKAFGSEVYYFSPKRIAPIFPIAAAAPEVMAISKLVSFDPSRANTSQANVSPADTGPTTSAQTDANQTASSASTADTTTGSDAGTSSEPVDAAATPQNPTTDATVISNQVTIVAPEAEVFVPPAAAPLSPLLPDQSQTLAVNVLSSLLGAAASYNGGVRNADYYVIKNAECPAILVEMGYVTHPIEGVQLKNPNYLDRLGYGIARGALEYLENNSRAL